MSTANTPENIECKSCGWWGMESLPRGRYDGGPCPWCDGTLVVIR